MPWFSDDDEATGSVYTVCGPAIVVPGLYARILEHERAPQPDPRYWFTPEGQRGEPWPPDWELGPSLELQAMELGRPVKLPSWCHHLGSTYFPKLGDPLPGLSEAIAEMESLYGKWVLLIVHVDDRVVPERKDG
jgi:hypothetical protein